MNFESSLLERLSNPDEESVGYRAEPRPERVAESVMRHLRHMLNTRQGSVPTIPNYGLPDFNDLVMRFPDAIYELRRSIKSCIEEYEPRLTRVKVDYITDEENPLNLRYEITAQVVLDDKKENIWFETTLDSSGRVAVRG